MDTFVKRFQPERYNDWINGTDYGPHPEDPTTTVAAAPLPSDKDVLLNKKNNSVSDTIIETLKKKCSPTMKKSFKERNPDVDMDEIQNNPNVPDDVKAAISGALTLTPEDELEESDGNEEEPALIPTNGKNFLDVYDNDLLFDMSDDEVSYRKGRRKRNRDIDEEWCASGNSRKNTKKKKKKTKDIKRENSNESEKRAKNKTPKKSKKIETTGAALIDQIIEGNSMNANEINNMISPAYSAGNSENSLPVQLSENYNTNSFVAIRNVNDGDGTAKLEHTENLVKLEIEELEIPAERLFKVKNVRKRSSAEKERTPKVKAKTKVSTIDAIVQSIESVVRGADYISIKTEPSTGIDSHFNEVVIETLKITDIKNENECSNIDNNERSMQQLNKIQGISAPQSPLTPPKPAVRAPTKNKQPRKRCSATVCNKSPIQSSNKAQGQIVPSQTSASAEVFVPSKVIAPPFKNKQTKNDGFADVYSKFLQESSTQNNYTPRKNPLNIMAKSQIIRNNINTGPSLSENVNSHPTNCDNENVGQGQTLKLSIQPTVKPQKTNTNMKKVMANKFQAHKVPERSINVHESINPGQWNQVQYTQTNGTPAKSIVYVRKDPAKTAESTAPVAIVAPMSTSSPSQSQSSQQIVYNYSVTPLTTIDNTKTIPINSSQSILADNRPQIAIEVPVRAVNLKAFKNTKLVPMPSMKAIQLPTHLEQRAAFETVSANKSDKILTTLKASLPISIPIYTTNATNEILPNGNAKHAAATVCLNNASGNVGDGSTTTICYIQQNPKNSNCIKTK